MAKTAALSFRIEEPVKVALEYASQQDERTVSLFVERLLRNWLLEHNYLWRQDDGKLVPTFPSKAPE